MAKVDKTKKPYSVPPTPESINEIVIEGKEEDKEGN